MNGESGDKLSSSSASQETEDSFEVSASAGTIEGCARELDAGVAQDSDENVNLCNAATVAAVRHSPIAEVAGKSKTKSKSRSAKSRNKATLQKSKTIQRLQCAIDNGDYALRELIVCVQRTFVAGRPGCGMGLREIAKQGMAVRYIELPHSHGLPPGVMWFLRTPWGSFDAQSPIVAPTLGPESSAEPEETILICWPSDAFVDLYTQRGACEDCAAPKCLQKCPFDIGHSKGFKAVVAKNYHSP